MVTMVSQSLSTALKAGRTGEMAGPMKKSTGAVEMSTLAASRQDRKSQHLSPSTAARVCGTSERAGLKPRRTIAVDTTNLAANQDQMWLFIHSPTSQWQNVLVLSQRSVLVCESHAWTCASQCIANLVIGQFGPTLVDALACVNVKGGSSSPTMTAAGRAMDLKW